MIDFWSAVVAVLDDQLHTGVFKDAQVITDALLVQQQQVFLVGV